MKAERIATGMKVTKVTTLIVQGLQSKLYVQVAYRQFNYFPLMFSHPSKESKRDVAHRQEVFLPQGSSILCLFMSLCDRVSNGVLAKGKLQRRHVVPPKIPCHSRTLTRDGLIPPFSPRLTLVHAQCISGTNQHRSSLSSRRQSHTSSET